MEEKVIDPTPPATPKPEVIQPVPPPPSMEAEGGGINLKKFWFLPLLLVLVVVIVGGMLWAMESGLILPKPSPSPTPTAVEDESTAALEEQGTSDEIWEIEADLNATDLSDLDKEVQDIEKELAAP